MKSAELMSHPRWTSFFQKRQICKGQEGDNPILENYEDYPSHEHSDKVSKSQKPTVDVQSRIRT